MSRDVYALFPRDCLCALRQQEAIRLRQRARQADRIPDRECQTLSDCRREDEEKTGHPDSSKSRPRRSIAFNGDGGADPTDGSRTKTDCAAAAGYMPFPLLTLRHTLPQRAK